MRRVQLITACGARHEIRDYEYADDYIDMPLIVDVLVRESLISETPTETAIGRRRFKYQGEKEFRDRQPIWVYREEV